MPMTTGEKMIWAAVFAQHGLATEKQIKDAIGRAAVYVECARTVMARPPKGTAAAVIGMLREMLGDDCDPLAAVREHLRRGAVQGGMTPHGHAAWWKKMYELAGAKP